jgi:aryl-alcohol dehydrogenase-like predicted oxidoreductase
MKYGTIPGLDKPVSRLIHGTIMLAEDRLAEGLHLLDDVVAAGGNAFDVAHVYGSGQCERVLGEWMRQRDNRDRVVIITKGAHPNRDRSRVTPYDIRSDLSDSLARLKTDHVDVYLLHRDDPEQPVGPLVDTLDELRRAGRIRVFGGSNWSHQRLQEANRYAAEHGLAGFTVSSPQYSLAVEVEPPWEGCVSITGARNAAARAWYTENRMPVLAWSSLGRGLMSGKVHGRDLSTLGEDEERVQRTFASEENFRRLERVEELAARRQATVPQIALAWVLRSPMNVFPIVGCFSGDEFRMCASAVEVELSDEELEYLGPRV